MMRFGPVLSWQPHRRWTFGFLGGLSVILAKTEYHYAQRAVEGVSIRGLPLQVDPRTGSISDSSVSLGAYSALRATFRLTEKCDLHGEVRHLWHDAIQLSAPLGSADVHLSDSFGVALGASYRF